MKENQPGQNNYQEEDFQELSNSTQDNLSNDLQSQNPDILNKTISRRRFLQYATGVAFITATGAVGANCIIPGVGNVNDSRREDQESTPEIEGIFPSPSATFTPEATSTNVPPTETPTKVPTLEPTSTSTLEPTSTQEPTVEPTPTPETIKYTGDIPCSFETIGELPFEIILNEGYPDAEEARKKFCLRLLAQLEYASKTLYKDFDLSVALDPDIGRQLEERMTQENITFQIPGVDYEHRDDGTPITNVEIDPTQGMVYEIVGMEDDSFKDSPGYFGITTEARSQITSKDGQLVFRYLQRSSIIRDNTRPDLYEYNIQFINPAGPTADFPYKDRLTGQTRDLLGKEGYDWYNQDLMFLPTDQPYDGNTVFKYWGDNGDEMRIPLFKLERGS
ncbi:MAG TPA: hypothetical protein PLD54_03245 [Candidatus Levybacteria bacterium]|nr:hypothetical protein [Candidatus Levybacteria bacterium]